MMKLLVPKEKSGVQYWRTWTPLWELEKRGLVELRTFEVRNFTSKEIADGLKWCDAVIGRGFSGTAGLKLLRSYQGLGKPVIVDHDDYNFDIDPLNRSYKWYGTEEIEMQNTKTGGKEWLWKDGVDGFHLQENRVNAGARLSVMEEAALMTTTTPYLKEKFKQLTGREDIVVIPNAVNKELWKPVPNAREKYKDGFRFGWFISDSHGSDLLYIREALRDFLKEHKDAKLVLMGDWGGVDLEGYFPKDQIETHEFCDLYADIYPVIAGCLGLDVGIAPLAHTEFNRCKSPLKFAEYTYLGYSTILENIETYNPYVTDGEHALLAGSPTEWKMALNTLYHDKGMRAKLKFNAKQLCDTFFDNSKVAMDHYNAYKWVLNRETVITH
jgi:glycosyltransferase involved in cell wall biosynthesis